MRVLALPCQELKHLTTAFGNLKAAQAKFNACMEALDSIRPENKGALAFWSRRRKIGSSVNWVFRGLGLTKSHTTDKKILVPLTSSLYVPGKLSDVEKVLVDVGTGYFVEKVGCPSHLALLPFLTCSFPLPHFIKSTKATKVLYNTKILTLRSNLSTLQGQIERKNDNANAVVEVLKSKLAQQDQENRAAAISAK